MRLRWVRRLASTVVLLALAAPVHAQSFGFPWWNDTKFQRDLALTADQAAKIDGVFQAAFTQLRQKKVDLDRHEEELSRLVASGADESLVTKQIDKVEAIRAYMNKMRTLMLLHERQLLTRDQRMKLNKLYEQREKDKTRPPRGDIR